MKKGFTLVELLFVMAVISILAGIGISQMSGSTDTAKNTAAKAELRNAFTEATLYYVDNNNSYTGFTPSSSKVTSIEDRFGNSGKSICLETAGQDKTFILRSNGVGEIEEGTCGGSGGLSFG